MPISWRTALGLRKLWCAKSGVGRTGAVYPTRPPAAERRYRHDLPRKVASPCPDAPCGELDSKGFSWLVWVGPSSGNKSCMRTLVRVAASALMMALGTGLAASGSAPVQAQPAPFPDYHWCPGQFWDPGWGNNWDWGRCHDDFYFDGDPHDAGHWHGPGPWHP